MATEKRRPGKTPNPSSAVLSAARPPLPPPDSLENPAPNPNRRTFTREGDLNATRLINPDALPLTPEELQEIGVQGAERVSIVINGIRHRTPKDRPAEYTLGIAVKHRNRVVFMKYPVQGNLGQTLPLALEEAVRRSPGMANLDLRTPYKELWDTGNYTPPTLQRLRDYGCKIDPTYPQPHDLANVLCKMAAEGILTPQAVDYHIYTGSITDGLRCYTAALLWGNGHANYFLQALPTSDLALAETKAAEWAFRLLPEQAQLLLCNANPELAAVWENGKNVRADLKEAVVPIAVLIRSRRLSFKIGAERYHYALAKVTRQMAANLYASTQPSFKTETLRKKAAKGKS